MNFCWNGLHDNFYLKKAFKCKTKKMFVSGTERNYKINYKINKLEFYR